MAEYITKEQVLETECEKCPVYDCLFHCPTYNALNNIPTADVVERSMIDKAIDEIEHARLANHNFDDRFIYSKCLEIIKRNIGE